MVPQPSRRLTTVRSGRLGLEVLQSIDGDVGDPSWIGVRTRRVAGVGPSSYAEMP